MRLPPSRITIRPLRREIMLIESNDRGRTWTNRRQFHSKHSLTRERISLEQPAPDPAPRWQDRRYL